MEAIGGILSPWRPSAQVVRRFLTGMFRLESDDISDTMGDLGALARLCKDLYAHFYRLNLNDDPHSANPFR